MTAADVLIESLIDWGVEVIFGLPGDVQLNLGQSTKLLRDFYPVERVNKV